MKDADKKFSELIQKYFIVNFLCRLRFYIISRIFQGYPETGILQSDNRKIAGDKKIIEGKNQPLVNY
ncbi:hypothetical protein [Microbulbifer sp. YPW1]|uniref:hypothetical protein n=1 Tax=Microbulbifer sp. YPW1 TaxID=2745199 RepID=UPI001C628873|nr:hypothetical protein [Microbulbifer sp. YPW1]